MTDLRKYLPLALLGGGAAAYFMFGKGTPAPTMPRQQYIPPSAPPPIPPQDTEEYEPPHEPFVGDAFIASSPDAFTPRFFPSSFVQAELDVPVMPKFGISLPPPEEFAEQMKRAAFAKQKPMAFEAIGRIDVKASEVMKWIETKQPWIFTMRYNLQEAKELPQEWTSSLNISIDTIDALHYFGNVMVFCMLIEQSQQANRADKAAIALKNFFLQFFNYHRWKLDWNGDVGKMILSQLGHFMCSYNPPPFHEVMKGSTGWYQPSELWWANYGGFGDYYDDMIDTSRCGFPSFKDPTYGPKLRKVFEEDGLMLIFEYASIKYANIGFLSKVNPKLGQMFSQAMESAIKGVIALAISVAGTLMGFAGASATIPILGWIAAAIAALAAFITGLVAYGAMVERNRQLRQKLSDRIDELLRVWFGRPGIEQSFSAYQLGLLLPPLHPWDDVIDPFYHHYTLVRSWGIPAMAVPQLPYYYLNLDFDLVVSLALPSENLLILRPEMNALGYLRDYSVVEIPQDQAGEAGVLNLGERFVGLG